MRKTARQYLLLTYVVDLAKSMPGRDARDAIRPLFKKMASSAESRVRAATLQPHICWLASSHLCRSTLSMRVARCAVVLRSQMVRLVAAR